MGKVYDSNPQMELESKENTYKEIANTPAGQLQWVNQNVFHHCKECLHVEGPAFSTPLVICDL
jgi:hypothetical protein